MLLLKTNFDHFYVLNFLRNENLQFSCTKFQQCSYSEDSVWLIKLVTSSIVVSLSERVSFEWKFLEKSLESFAWFKNLFEFTYAGSMEIALSSILLAEETFLNKYLFQFFYLQITNLHVHYTITRYRTRLRVT